MLHDRGYAVSGGMYCVPAPEYAQNGFGGAWPECCGEFRCFGEHSAFYHALDEFFAGRERDGKSFAFFAADRSCLFGDNVGEKEDASELHSYCGRGFELLDRTAGFMLDALKRRGLLDRTIFVAYGPYGMDPWLHGLFHGRITRIPPYASACWTPLLVAVPGSGKCIDDHLICVVDLRHLISNLLFPEEKTPPPESELDGRDVFAYPRSMAISQNMFALENESDPSNAGLAKGYAAADGSYRLVVTSDGGKMERGGLEFFFDTRDPTNTRNLLDFFDIDAAGFITTFEDREIVHPYFDALFSRREVMEMADVYNRLRAVLADAVRVKESRAAAFAGEEARGHSFPGASFTKKKSRG
ncbi:MAG: hypothetical protein LBT97_07985 [Planctomycetota bacterium]|nr:hypothetical protein [Planctomycetota bacterium]